MGEVEWQSGSWGGQNPVGGGSGGAACRRVSHLLASWWGLPRAWFLRAGGLLGSLTSKALRKPRPSLPPGLTTRLPFGADGRAAPFACSLKTQHIQWGFNVSGGNFTGGSPVISHWRATC